MRTLTKTGIRILSAKYRSILIKCAIINASLFIGAFGASSAMATGLPTIIQDETKSSYILESDETMDADLGTLAGANRNFIINGDGYALKGADSYAGITVKSGQTLTLNDVTMKNFKKEDGTKKWWCD
ncbi:MAG: hypothetical protein MJ170_03880 [Alphaproteobacteria bacterium]|nr:hypothetical protein [Alphaproteobacteria bacterium]